MNDGNNQYKNAFSSVGSNPTEVLHFCRYCTTDQHGEWICMAKEDASGFCKLHVCPLKEKHGKRVEK